MTDSIRRTYTTTRPLGPCAVCVSENRPPPSDSDVRVFRCSACRTQIGICVADLEAGWAAKVLEMHRASFADEPPDGPYSGCAAALLERVPPDELRPPRHYDRGNAPVLPMLEWSWPAPGVVPAGAGDELERAKHEAAAALERAERAEERERRALAKVRALEAAKRDPTTRRRR